jgi:hypothetical protein
MLSALLCVSLGYVQDPLVDSSLLKAYLVLLGFLLGFRNSNANQRRVEAMSNIQHLMGSIWALYIVMPADSREKMRKYFAVAIRAVVQQMPVHSTDFTGWFTLNALHPMDRATPIVDGKIPVVLSARSLLVAALQFSEAEVIVWRQAMIKVSLETCIITEAGSLLPMMGSLCVRCLQ